MLFYNIDNVAAVQKTGLFSWEYALLQEVIMKIHYIQLIYANLGRQYTLDFVVYSDAIGHSTLTADKMLSRNEESLLICFLQTKPWLC